MELFNNIQNISSICHSLQVIFIYYKGENCDSDLRLVVDGDDNGKFRLEMDNMNDSYHRPSQ